MFEAKTYLSYLEAKMYLFPKTVYPEPTFSLIVLGYQIPKKYHSNTKEIYSF